jgi:DNA mismatch repair protein MutS
LINIVDKFKGEFVLSGFNKKGLAKGKNSDTETPLMRQYNEIKAKYPDAILLFRVGDFYETFGEDAIRVSSIVGIVLTKRHNGSASEIELAGFPHHSLENYLPKLVRAGYRVAVCDQLEDPKLTKKIVKRGVTELVTPGVAFNDQVLDQKRNNFLAAVYIKGTDAGVAFTDVSTGEFHATQGSLSYIAKVLQGYSPSEVLYSKPQHKDFVQHFGEQFYTYRMDDWAFTDQFATDILQRHFRVTNFKGFGIEKMPLAIIASGAVVHYLEDTQHDRLSHLQAISRIDEADHVWIDRFTLRNLEVLSSPHENGIPLIQVLDQTVTPMGGRTLRRWLAFPLKDKSAIEKRHEAVDYFRAQRNLRDDLCASLLGMGDLERLIAKVAAGKCSPREMVQLGRALLACNAVRSRVEQEYDESLKTLVRQIDPLDEVHQKVSNTLCDECPTQIGKGEVIRPGVSAELDELRRLRTSGKDYLADLQQREASETGINSLKIGYNNVFGYYLEVRNTFKDKVPETWIRKQTLTQAERYITEELKEYESKILGAEDKIFEIESAMFQDLCGFVSGFVGGIQKNARLIGEIDGLIGFGSVADRWSYSRPVMSDDTVLNIKGGRHPVIERLMAPGEKYVDNDILLDSDNQQIIMITGPNMSGKSALLRQTALIVLMAQAGSFVPAASAHVGIVDKIFTRVGASDNLSAGESTFMVEMNETASILNNLSERSLILLDEIGRGTSTFDGISIAWAIAEYLHEHPKCKAKTLFATHYHELNEMAARFGRIKNYHVSVKETGSRILFLRKLEPGGTNHSFGIHVAKMAGMPNFVIERANSLLRQLEDTHLLQGEGSQISSAAPAEIQANGECN